jgi:hypothetical protein
MSTERTAERGTSSRYSAIAAVGAMPTNAGPRVPIAVSRSRELPTRANGASERSSASTSSMTSA